MPWTPNGAFRRTHKAKSAIAKRQFADVANSVLERTGDKSRAIREANAAVAKRKNHSHEAAHPHDPYPEERRRK